MKGAIILELGSRAERSDHPLPGLESGHLLEVVDPVHVQNELHHLLVKECHLKNVNRRSHGIMAFKELQDQQVDDLVTLHRLPRDLQVVVRLADRPQPLLFYGAP